MDKWINVSELNEKLELDSESAINLKFLKKYKYTEGEDFKFKIEPDKHSLLITECTAMEICKIINTDISKKIRDGIFFELKESNKFMKELVRRRSDADFYSLQSNVNRLEALKKEMDLYVSIFKIEEGDEYDLLVNRANEWCIEDLILIPNYKGGKNENSHD